MLSDLRTAWRFHLSQPGFTAVALLMLAIGIGAVTTVFSVANIVLLKSLPYPEARRLTAIYESRPRENRTDGVVSYADFIDWRAQNSVFSAMAAYEPTTFNFTGQGDPENIPGASVSVDFFDTLGIHPSLGRAFGPEDERRGAVEKIILSHGVWQRRFGGDASLIGRTIMLNGVPHVVAGVMPASFVAPVRTWEMLRPMTLDTRERSTRANHNLIVYARMKPGVSIGRAHQELDAISKRLEAGFPENRGHYASVVPLDQAVMGQMRPATRVLLGAVGLVLLIACFNVANLLLARSVTRSREISVRLALGASRARLIRQLLIESLALSFTGAAAGVLASLWGIAWVKAAAPAGLGIAPEDIRIDATVLIFAVVLAVLSGVLFGLAPALTAVRTSFNEVIRSSGRQHTASPWRQRQRAAIVAGEMALSVLLLVGAGLLIRSFIKLMEVDPGFTSEKLLTMTVELPYSTYKDDSRKIAFQKDLLARVSALPGVVRTGLTSFLPVSGQDSRMGFVVDGIDPDPREPRRANYRIVSPGYFESMQIPLRKGRFFSDSETRESGRFVMIVNEAAAKKYWPGRDPIGTQARLTSMKPWAEVIGVVGDVRHWGLEESARPEAYLSLWQAPFWLNNLVVRTAGDPMQLAGEVRRQLWSIDKDLPPAAIRSMQDRLDESYAVRRFYMLLLTALAIIALLLAAAGIYAQLAYSVSQRIQEIGLRMALGATQKDVVRLVLRNGLGMACAGAILGVIAAIAFGRLIEKLLFGIKPLDPATLVAAPLALLAVAAVACLLPSWRAAKADPAVALRHE